MAKRWSHEEDAFLLRWHPIGANFIASHDLGRPNGAGARRLKQLTESGARKAYARMILAKANFEALAGRHVCKDEIDHWETELNAP